MYCFKCHKETMHSVEDYDIAPVCVCIMCHARARKEIDDEVERILTSEGPFLSCKRLHVLLAERKRAILTDFFTMSDYIDLGYFEQYIAEALLDMHDQDIDNLEETRLIYPAYNGLVSLHEYLVAKRWNFVLVASKMISWAKRGKERASFRPGNVGYQRAFTNFKERTNANHSPHSRVT